MTNDARLGLVVGVILVIGTAVAFFRKDLVAERPPAGRQEMAVAATTASAPANTFRAPATPTTVTATQGGHNHTVKFGESLFSLAQQYYGDGKKYTEIYRVNRRLVSNPDYVPPGTVLFIPDLDR
jgi:nucleoid-associated protein YgaU